MKKRAKLVETEEYLNYIVEWEGEKREAKLTSKWLDRMIYKPTLDEALVYGLYVDYKDLEIIRKSLNELFKKQTHVLKNIEYLKNFKEGTLTNV
jgi:hypothetical protein